MIQPTDKQTLLLTPMERRAYKLADWVNQNVKPPFILWNAVFMYILIWFALSRRLRVEGTEHISHLTPNDPILIAANHRTFFDFFVVTWVNYDQTTLPRKIFFPVRSNFFYDNPLGMLLNLIMGGCAMFPPMFRRKDAREFNHFSVRRIVEELDSDGCVIGIHPEGTRNKDPDPSSLLPPKRGVATILGQAKTVYFVPVFLRGLSNSILKEMWKNWTDAKNNPIIVRYGPPQLFIDGTLDSNTDYQSDSPSNESELLEWVMKRIQEQNGANSTVP